MKSRRATIWLWLTLGAGAVGLEPVAHQERCSEREVKWTGSGEIEWPSPLARNMYERTGRYVPENALASRMASYRDEHFVAFPRYKLGVPITLGKLSVKGKSCESSLGPFPGWPQQESGNCSAFQSVIDIYLDQFGILWLLDAGLIDYLDGRGSAGCPPKLVAISAKSGKVVKSFEIGSLCNEASLLQYLVVDYGRDGRAYVYVSDAANRWLLVYEGSSGRGHRVHLPKLVSKGCDSLDVLYLVLLRQGLGQSQLVFGYLCSSQLFAVRAADLQKGSNRGRVEAIGQTDNFILLGTDNASSVYFRRQDQADVYAWNLLDQSKPLRKIYRGNGYMLPTQLLADKRGRLRLLESNFYDFFSGSHSRPVEHNIKIILRRTRDKLGHSMHSRR